jgi:hypothetical protein
MVDNKMIQISSMNNTPIHVQVIQGVRCVGVLDGSTVEIFPELT